MNKIRYFDLEGIVGVGKSRQAKELANKLSSTFPGQEIVETFEPGGSPIADEVRRVVQGMPISRDMDTITEQYGYAMSRAETLRKVVRPALDRGAFVVTDRSVYTSFAYQGFGRGLGPDVVMEINARAVDGLWPHAAFFINLDIDTALSRCHDKYGDKFELMGKDFFVRCIKGYHYLVENFPHIYEIDGSGTREEVHERIWTIASGLLGLK